MLSRSWDDTRKLVREWLEERLGMKFRDVSWGPDLKENGELCDVTLEVQGGNLTFAVLKQISEVLGTTHIDIGSGHESDGCPTCGYGCESWVELEIKKAVLPTSIYEPYK